MNEVKRLIRRKQTQKGVGMMQQVFFLSLKNMQRVDAIKAGSGRA